MRTLNLIVGAAAILAAACQPARTSSASGPQKLDPKTPVARMASGTITAGELDELVKGELRKMESEYQERMYEARRGALESLIVKRLVEGKAKAENLTAEEYAQREVLKKVPEPSDEEIRNLYDRAVAGGEKLPPLDKVKPEIARFIKQQKGREAATAWYEELKKEAKVEILLPAWEPPKVEVAAVGPAKGPASAPITIVEFSDFECPFCVRAEQTVKDLLDAYPGKIRVVYRDFPLPNHKQAPKAAEAAHCADDQGKYWEMHGKLFAGEGKLALTDLKGYAREIGLDGGRFDRCLESGEKAKVVESHRKAGEEAGVSGTPAFFINGRLLSGAQPLESFRAIVDKELGLKK
jgi:predicted DsbA family dithiol-disulfide isomerase